MKNEIILNALELFKHTIIHPAILFEKTKKNHFKPAIYLLFSLSVLIPFFKSFTIKTYNVNFFSHEIINRTVSFLNIPQTKWFIALLGFAMFLNLMAGSCRLLLKKSNKKNLSLCFLAVGCSGIMLQALFYILHHILSQKSVNILSNIFFIWIIYLSITAIKISQETSYVKSTIIYIFSGIPIVFIIGTTGLAPFLLWLILPE